MKVDITCCARCEGNHQQLEFTRLSNPMDTYEWWAMCPELQQPIVMSVMNLPDSKNED